MINVQSSRRDSKGCKWQVLFLFILFLDNVISFSNQAREKESEDYERELEVSKRMYGNMEQRLTSEIKLLRKLN
jgi:hypothetical protein